MSSRRTEYVATLAQTHALLSQLTATLPEAALDFRPDPQDWTIREILAHLVDDEMFVMRTRLERMVKEENPHLAPHDERTWYAGRNTSRDTLEELLGDFALQRSASLGIITFLREEEWQRGGFQPEYGQFTAEEWLGRWAEHDTVHIRQIEATLQAYMAQSQSTEQHS